MTQLAIVLMITLTLLSCRPSDLVTIVDQYDYVVRLADLTRAVINENYTIDWKALKRLETRYDVELVGPTDTFLVAAENLKDAYKELQQKIAAEQQHTQEMQALERALKQINNE